MVAQVRTAVGLRFVPYFVQWKSNLVKYRLVAPCVAFRNSNCHANHANSSYMADRQFIPAMLTTGFPSAKTRVVTGKKTVSIEFCDEFFEISW